MRLKRLERGQNKREEKVRGYGKHEEKTQGTSSAFAVRWENPHLSDPLGYARRLLLKPRWNALPNARGEERSDGRVQMMLLLVSSSSLASHGCCSLASLETYVAASKRTDHISVIVKHDVDPILVRKVEHSMEPLDEIGVECVLGRKRS